MIENRVLELQALHWKKQQAIADRLGLQKPEEVSWDDFCQQIAIAEAAQAEQTATTEESEPVALADSIDYQFQGNRCPVCHQKRRTNDVGLFCPAYDPQCPRYQ